MNDLPSFAQRDGEINPWVIAVTVMLATFMEVLDTSVANIALPHIAGSLSASVDESTWVLTSYLVSNAIVLPLSGWFSRVFGRKNFYMFCVALFTISSFMCGLAPTLPLLVTFRVLQGAGGGALQPVSQAILVESFPRAKQGAAMAVYAMGVVFAPAVGPTLGGWITDNFTWRWIFFINIPIGVISLLMTQLLIADPPYLKRENLRTLKIDYIGIGLLGVGLGALQIMLDKGQRDDWFSSHFIVACAVITAVCLIAVVIWELRSKAPIVDFGLLRERNFALATMTMFVLGLVLYGTTVLLPEMLQTLLGYTALASGMVLSPGAFVLIAILPIVGWLLGKIEARWLVTFGAAVLALSLLYMSHFDLDLDFHTAMMARIYQSCGMAFLFVPINVMAFYFISKEKTSNATGIINLARNIGGSVGISMVTTQIERGSQVHQNFLVGHATPLSDNYRAMLAGTAQNLIAHGSSVAQAAEQAKAILYGLIQRQAAMLAYVDDFRVLGGVSLAIVPFMFLMKKMRPSKPVSSAMH
ncbi:MAG: DHA2 family efflux MFS transporter permease subunit [Candidatus Acidiferrales bacterium]|jgi:DHA2 family multidrug resistance protein